MSDIPFYKTVMGHRFYENDFPKLIENIDKLTKAMEWDQFFKGYKCPHCKNVSWVKNPSTGMTFCVGCGYVIADLKKEVPK